LIAQARATRKRLVRNGANPRHCLMLIRSGLSLCQT
jgi:hypothetical protein